MSEKYITTSNKILYYLVAPCLLLYFVLIDIGVIKCTITGLLIFSIANVRNIFFKASIVLILFTF